MTDGGPLTALTRLELGRGEENGQQREAFIQDLVHAHPEVIPMADIEPAMSPLIPVCRELPVAGYFADNLFRRPSG